MKTKSALPTDVLYSEFGGTLLYRLTGWEWIDGTPEPDVNAITLFNQTYMPPLFSKSTLLLPLNWKDRKYWPAIGEDIFTTHDSQKEIYAIIDHLIANDACVRASKIKEGWLIPVDVWRCSLGIVIGISNCHEASARIEDKAKSLGWAGDDPLNTICE